MLDTIVNTKYKYVVSSLLCSVCYIITSYLYVNDAVVTAIGSVCITRSYSYWLHSYFYWFSSYCYWFTIGSYYCCFTLCYLLLQLLHHKKLLLLMQSLLWTVPLYCSYWCTYYNYLVLIIAITTATSCSCYCSYWCSYCTPQQ